MEKDVKTPNVWFFDLKMRQRIYFKSSHRLS